MTILTIIGARPQFIKASALSRAFSKHPEIKEIVVHTGQHFDDNMSDVFFRDMDMPKPHYNLNINSLSHGAMTGLMLIETEKVILRENPDFVLVYGDTNSTLAGALAAKKQNIKLIHVEAGLRSHNMRMPEEINRILTDRISDLLFCPTSQAVSNLNAEGFDKFDCRIFLSGDIMLDNALFFADKAFKSSTIIKDLNLETEPYLLCTIHRAENTDDDNKLSQIINALNKLSRDYRIILPLHPGTRKIIEAKKTKLAFDPLPPAGYLDMINLIRHSKMILTDSGGLQKEAYFFKKFCVTLRDQTEWTELPGTGTNILSGANTTKIIESVNLLSVGTFPSQAELYGDGKTAEKICSSILEVYANH